jgi:dCMP deaminase
MELCPAQHAEENAISNASRNGVSTLGCTLYMNSIQPCKNCIGTLINAGIVEIVIEQLKPYDTYSEFIYSNSKSSINP